MTFPSLYRARAVAVSGAVIRAFVPQVFGNTAVTISDFLGGPPSDTGMGWVFFQAGNPEFPVWTSGFGGGGGGNGNGSVGTRVWSPYKVVTSAISIDDATTGNQDIVILDGSELIGQDGWVEVSVSGGYAGNNVDHSVNARQGVYSPSFLDPVGQPWITFGYMASAAPHTWETIGDCLFNVPVTAFQSLEVYWRGNWSPSTTTCSFRGNVIAKFFSAAGEVISGAAIRGPAGPPGPPGPAGPPGGTYEFTLSSATTSPPAAGEFRINNTDQTAATQLFVSKESAHGIDVASFLASHTSGYTWYLYDKADPSIRVEYVVSSTPIDHGTWVEYTVSYEEGTGTIPPGPIYAAGTTGQGGGGGGTEPSFYRHIQTTPSTSWVIVHNLPFRPNVSVVDSSGREVVGEISYTSSTTVTITFSAAFGGEAYLS